MTVKKTPKKDKNAYTHVKRSYIEQNNLAHTVFWVQPIGIVTPYFRGLVPYGGFTNDHPQTELGMSSVMFFYPVFCYFVVFFR
jgi:hypothetical protein